MKNVLYFALPYEGSGSVSAVFANRASSHIHSATVISLTLSVNVHHTEKLSVM